MGFEPTISQYEWPQNYALHRTATGTGNRSPVGEDKYNSTYYGNHSVCLLPTAVCLSPFLTQQHYVLYGVSRELIGF